MRTTAFPQARPRQLQRAFAGALVWIPTVALGALVAAHLVFFAIRTAHLLGYPYPLDYGEGPILTQARLILEGTPPWRLYGDPGAAPYAVVNYPPVYHALAALVALPLGGGAHTAAALLAGRLVSLVAALGVVGASWALSRPANGPASGRGLGRPGAHTLLVALAFLGIPIAREWSAVMRVDMLGVCLGLWGLAAVRRSVGRWGLLWAAPLLALSLLVKPSLLAAPAAALAWLLFRDWRRALALGALLAGIGGAAVGLLQLASGGWFLLHVLDANANPYDFDLAHAFWRDQMVILRPLFGAAAVCAIVQLFERAQNPGGLAPYAGRAGERRGDASHAGTTHAPPFSQAILLPLYYTLFGAMTAFGIGKLGAYTNYFLELYAGLFWLAASGLRREPAESEAAGDTVGERAPWAALSPLRPLVPSLVSGLILGLVALSLTRYYPVWSETYLLPAGVVEGRNPPRISFGAYGVWQDLRREQAVLEAKGRINAALVAEVRAAGGPIFTDVPGVAAQAGQLALLQTFEHRMLLDVGLWDQRPLLRDLASGRVPLVALDYLGNWLTSEMIALITKRYAQDGSVGTYTIYRPVEPGPRVAADVELAPGVRLAGYHLAPSADGRAVYGPGETVVLTLDLRAGEGAASLPTDSQVAVQLTDGEGRALAEFARPLLYGALAPADWGEAEVQHMQPVPLSPELPPGSYGLAVELRAGGRGTGPRALARFVVEESGGRLLGEQGYYVPPALIEAWVGLGGYDGPGDPLTPAVPFEGHITQCFQRACLRLAEGGVTRLPLGELVQLAEARPPLAPGSSGAAELSGAFLELWEASGGEAALGPPITPELLRGATIVQYTRFARLERPAEGGPARLASLGEEWLRLPGGVPYRWP